MDMDKFFQAKSIAIIGVSKDPKKVGHVILRNIVDGGYKGRIFVVNPNAGEIAGFKSYPSVLSVKDKIDMAIISVPTEFVMKVIGECGRKKIRNVVIITSGFKEIGNYRLEESLKKKLKKFRIRAIGPNCLGVFDARSKLDSLFLPRYRMKRPKEGGISFICQSGAIGSAILDMATSRGYGFSKFVSYGNAVDIDESDLLKYMGNDNKTKVICMYIEGVHNGRKFLETAKSVSQKKPIVAIKGGITEEGSKAALSHTGSLAGSAEVYKGAFRQAGVIQVESLEEMFDIAKAFEKSAKPRGSRGMIITNGGGYGILSTDYIVKYGLRLAELSSESKKNLRRSLPKIINIKNPLDLAGDATTERYKIAVEASLNDSNIDVVLVDVLYQTPLISTDIIDVIIEFDKAKKKPILVVSTGGEFTEMLSRELEENGIPTYSYPINAVKSIKGLVEYYCK